MTRSGSLRRTILAVACLVAACGAGRAGFAEAGEKPTPMDFWLNHPGVVLLSSGANHVDGKLDYTVTTRVSDEGERLFEGERLRARKLHFEFKDSGADSAHRTTVMLELERVTETACETVATVYDDGSPEVMAKPYVDLRAPIQPGTGWSFTFPTRFTNQVQETPVPTRYESVIESVAEEVSTPAGVFKQCLKVHEHATSVSPFLIRRGDGRAVQVTATQDLVRYWCPHLGAIKEESSTVYSLPGNPEAVVQRDTHFIMLVEVLKKKPAP